MLVEIHRVCLPMGHPHLKPCSHVKGSVLQNQVAGIEAAAMCPVCAVVPAILDHHATRHRQRATDSHARLRDRGGCCRNLLAWVLNTLGLQLGKPGLLDGNHEWQCLKVDYVSFKPLSREPRRGTLEKGVHTCARGSSTS